MEYKGIIALCVLVFLAASCNRQQSTATINGHVLQIEQAQTQALREKGLSNRESLDQNSGMIFLFEKPDKYSFWMNEMRFPLDFIWIKDNKVIQITTDVPVLPLQTYTPEQVIDSMIEVNAGWSVKNNIKVGDSVVLTR